MYVYNPTVLMQQLHQLTKDSLPDTSCPNHIILHILPEAVRLDPFCLSLENGKWQMAWRHSKWAELLFTSIALSTHGVSLIKADRIPVVQVYLWLHAICHSGQLFCEINCTS